MPILPPPRKNPPNVHFVRQDKTPLQILLHLGISKQRAYENHLDSLVVFIMHIAVSNKID